MTVCIFEVHWHFNDKPDDLKKDISTIKLTPNYTVESMTEELEMVVATERRINKKSTITDYYIKFV